MQFHNIYIFKQLLDVSIHYYITVQLWKDKFIMYLPNTEYNLKCKLL